MRRHYDFSKGRRNTYARRLRNPGILDSTFGHRLTAKPLGRDGLKGLTEAYIAPDGDVYLIRDADETPGGGGRTHAEWADRFMGLSEKELEKRGWAKIQWGYLQHEGFLTEHQRDIVEEWLVLNKKRVNPPLGNSGLEFKQAAARLYLLDAIHLAGANTDATDPLIAQAFAFAKLRWQQHHNRILPAKEWPALRLEATLRLAQLVASGGLKDLRS